MIIFLLFVGTGFVCLLAGAHFHEQITSAWDTSVAWIKARFAKK